MQKLSKKPLFFMPDLSGPVAIQYLVVLDIDHWEVQDISWRSPLITGGAVEAQAVGLVQKPLAAAAWKAFYQLPESSTRLFIRHFEVPVGAPGLFEALKDVCFLVPA